MADDFLTVAKALSRLAKAGHVQVAKTGRRYLYSLTAK